MTATTTMMASPWSSSKGCHNAHGRSLSCRANRVLLVVPVATLHAIDVTPTIVTPTVGPDWPAGMHAGRLVKLWTQAIGGPPIPRVAATLRLGSSLSPLRPTTS